MPLFRHVLYTYVSKFNFFYIYIYICINTESIQMASKEKQPILGKTKDMFQYMLPVLT